MKKFKFETDSFIAAMKNKMSYKDTLRIISPAIGVSVSTLSRVMRGSEARMRTILAVCSWLERPITDFISYHHEETT